ncbi:uncharacterized protein LOC133815118 [Humulus lupulus]|uniref:uncharacterized protein LOC133815118 n=1 Tax=Humulus lupulus TaxID=3486 RepID=UPI002B410EEE|nr:uncharacterized protein LOC133815118 [Humulus lupulus]
MTELLNNAFCSTTDKVQWIAKYCCSHEAFASLPSLRPDQVLARGFNEVISALEAKVKAVEDKIKIAEDKIKAPEDKVKGVEDKATVLSEEFKKSNEDLAKVVVAKEKFKKASETNYKEAFKFQEDLSSMKKANRLEDRVKLLEEQNAKRQKQKDSKKEKTDNSLAFVHKEEKKSISDASDGFTDETLALLTKNYAKFLKRNYKKNFPGEKENVPRRKFGGNNKQTQQSGDKKNMGIQCRECDGFRHIQVECANTLKKKKALAATWSDSDEEKSSSSSDGSDEEKQVVALMAKSHQSMCSEDDGNSSSSDVDNEGRQHAYEEMFAQWEYMAKLIKGLTCAKQQLQSEKAGLEDTVKKLTK